MNGPISTTQAITMCKSVDQFDDPLAANSTATIDSISEDSSVSNSVVWAPDGQAPGGQAPDGQAPASFDFSDLSSEMTRDTALRKTRSLVSLLSSTRIVINSEPLAVFTTTPQTPPMV